MARTFPGCLPTSGPAKGLARAWQSTELFDDLDVSENLTVAARGSGAGTGAAGKDNSAAAAVDAGG